MLRHADSPHDARSPSRRLSRRTGAARLRFGGARDASGARPRASRRAVAGRGGRDEPVPAGRCPLAGPGAARAAYPDSARLVVVAAGARGRRGHTRCVEPGGAGDAWLAAR